MQLSVDVRVFFCVFCSFGKLSCESQLFVNKVGFRIFVNEQDFFLTFLKIMKSAISLDLHVFVCFFCLVEKSVKQNSAAFCFN